MKISLTPAFNNTKITSKEIKKQAISAQNNDIKEIPQSSISETIGRSQLISFRANNFPGERFTEYSWDERNDAKKKILNTLVCDNETGDRTHIKTDKNGNFIGSDEYYVQRNSRKVTILDDSGISTITTLTPTTKTQEKLDSENRPIVYAHSDAEGNKRVEVTDYRRGRKVVKETIKGKEQPLRVFNIDTGEEVTSGPLVVDKKYDKESDTYITENIVTKSVLKREKTTPKGFLLSKTIYFPETTLIKTQIDYIKDNDSYETRTYSGTENNPLVSLVIEPRDKSTQQVKIYEDDGNTIFSNILYIRKRNSEEVASEIKYKGDSEIIEERIVYGKAGARTEFYYSETPNIPTCSLEYDKNGTRIAETYFAKDGKTPTIRNEFKEDGSTVNFKFNEEGKLTKTRYFTSQNKLEYMEIFDPKTEALRYSISFNLENENRTITIYDEEYETAYKQTVATKNGLTLSQTIFHPDGETPQYIRRYRKDRSYTISAFDEKGIKLGVKDFNADGTQRKK